MVNSPDGDLVGRLNVELDQARKMIADYDRLLHDRAERIEGLEAFVRSLPVYFRARGLATTVGLPVE